MAASALMNNASSISPLSSVRRISSPATMAASALMNNASSISPLSNVRRISSPATMAASALMNNPVGYLFLILVLVPQTVLVSQLVNGVALLPPHTAASLAHCGASLWHYKQRIAALHAGMLFTAVFAAALLLALYVRHRAAGGANEAQLPARMLRASKLLAVALSLASTVLAAPTLFYVMEVRMAAVFYCLSGSAKATLWFFYAMAGLACGFVHYCLAALVNWYE